MQVRTIRKYTLNEYGQTLVPVPIGALILSIQLVDDRIRMWVEVDHTEPRTMNLVMDARFTGDNYPYQPTDRFIATVVSNGIVSHIFQVQG